MTDYVLWQFVYGPKWLLVLAWNLERALVRLFSVPVMAKTLFAHWHKDVMSYRTGGIEALIMSFLWNQISRAIGFAIRSIVLFVWIITSVFIAYIMAGIVVLFVMWPILIVGGIVWSFVVMVTG